MAHLPKSLLQKRLEADGLTLKQTPASLATASSEGRTWQRSDYLPHTGTDLLSQLSAPRGRGGGCTPWARRGLGGTTHNQTPRGGSGQMHPPTPHCRHRPRPWGVPHQGWLVWAPGGGQHRPQPTNTPTAGNPLCSAHSTCWRPSSGLAGCGGTVPAPYAHVAPAGSCQSARLCWERGLRSRKPRRRCTLTLFTSSPSTCRVGTQPPLTDGEPKAGMRHNPTSRERKWRSWARALGVHALTMDSAALQTSRNFSLAQDTKNHTIYYLQRS